MAILYYYLPPNIIETIGFLLKRASVKGKDTKKVKDFVDSINNQSTRPYYAIEEKNVRFIAGILNETVIPASYSAVYLETITALAKSLKELPPSHQPKVVQPQQQKAPVDKEKVANTAK